MLCALCLSGSLVEFSARESFTQKGRLIFGIVGASLLAIIFGAVSLSRKEKNSGMAIAGLILGIVWAILATLAIIASSL